MGEFNYESSKSKLTNLRLDSDEGPRITLTIPGDVIGTDSYEMQDENYGRHEHLLRLAGWVDVESRVTVCRPSSRSSRQLLTTQVGCAGAVISYLQRRRATRYLPGDCSAHGFFRISALEMFSLNETMYMFGLIAIVPELTTKVRQCRYTTVATDHRNRIASELS